MKYKKLILISLTALTILSCNQSKSNTSSTTEKASEVKEANDQSNPVWVVNQIFEAARNSKYESLLTLCDPNGGGDGDTKQICAVYLASKEEKDEFNSYFKFGQVIGKAVIAGDEATVQIKFGPQGNKDETMNLSKRDGKWYLRSF